MQNPDSPDRREDERERNNQSGRVPVAPTAAGCPDTEALDALIDGRLSGDEALRLEEHLLSCPACTAYVEALGPGELPGEPLEPAAIWGSSIACAVLGPPDLSRSALIHLRGRLEKRGIRVASPDAAVPWAVEETSSGQVAGDAVDANRLAAFARSLRELIAPDSPGGALIDAGRGLLDRHGPYGLVFERTLEAAPRVRPGEVLLTREVADRLEPLGVRMAPRSDELVRMVPGSAAPRRLERWISALDGALKGWWGGWLEGLEGAGARLEVGSGWRSARRGVNGARSRGQNGRTPVGDASGVIAHVEPGDQLSLHYEAPPRAWLYLLLRPRDGLTAYDGGEPIRTPAQASRGVVMLKPPAVRGHVGIYLLVTPVRVEGLEPLVQSIAPAADDESGLLVLLGERLLSEKGIESFLLLEAGAFELTAHPGQ